MRLPGAGRAMDDERVVSRLALIQEGGDRNPEEPILGPCQEFHPRRSRLIIIGGSTIARASIRSRIRLNFELVNRQIGHERDGKNVVDHSGSVHENREVL